MRLPRLSSDLGPMCRVVYREYRALLRYREGNGFGELYFDRIGGIRLPCEGP